MVKKILFVLFLVLAVVPIFVISVEGKSDSVLISPASKTARVVALNQWQPQQVLGTYAQAPLISAKSAIFIDAKDGKVLYAKDVHERLPIASLVKVMTVLIALEHKKMNDVYTISETAAQMEPDKMLLIASEKLTLEELLDGIFLVSANDAAEAIAEGTVGSKEEFISLMNSKALQLGMVDTYYANPTGLDEDDKNSYSSAYDLAILVRYLIRNYPQVVNISSSYHIYLPQTDTHQDYDLYSGINLLTTYPGVVGFKTGFTPEAGLTLITLARKNNHEVIGVLLGSGDRRDEARDLLDYSFGQLGGKNE